MLMTNAFSHSVKLDVKRSLCYRGGAEVARGAHNSEDIRSKRISGIHSNLSALQKQSVKLDIKRSWCLAYISGRISTIYSECREIETHCQHHHYLTGMAQRQRAWLITTRSLDRNGLPVSIPIRQLYRSGRSSWTLNAAT